jgi:dolichol-phosphate mannosyltransferase
MKSLIIIPTYNEKENIEEIIKKINQIVDPDKADILVVDDNSPDETFRVVERLMKDYKNIFLKKRSGKLGLASAYLEVINHYTHTDKGKYEIIITMDADLSHDPKHIKQMLHELESNDFDVVVGSRYIRGGGVKDFPLKRFLLSFLGNFYVRNILRTKIKDMASGFMALKTSSISIFDFKKFKAQGFAFLSELKYVFNFYNLKIKEIPIIFTNRERGASKISNNIIFEGLIMPWILFFKDKSNYLKSGCVSCGGSLKFYVRKKNAYNLFICNKCGLIQVMPQISSDVLERYYDQEYFLKENLSKTEKFSYPDYSKSISFKESLYRDILREIKQLGNSVKSILDIGAAYGDFVSMVSDSEYSCSGIDISKYAVFQAKERGRSVTNDSTDELLGKNKRYDLVTMLDLFEHLNDPVQFLDKLKEILNDKGYILMVTPDTKSLSARILGKNWYLINPPQHLFYWSNGNIKEFLSNRGFDIVKIKPLRKRFSLSYWFYLFSIWTGLKFLRKINFSFLNVIIFPWLFKDNILVIARKK